MYGEFEIGAVVPARDEEAAVGLVVEELRALRGEEGGPLVAEIVVCDNGSIDRTAEVARAAGARVVFETRKGYGAACRAGLRALDPSVGVVLFVDADRSVVTEEALSLLAAIARGADLAVGARGAERCERGSLPPHQRMGNRLAAFFIRRLWRHPMTDLGPFRAIRREALERLRLRDRTYGWTVEMQVKAIQAGLRVVEIPVGTRRRIGVSKISGTLRGTIGAAWRILSTIVRLRLWPEVPGTFEVPSGGGPPQVSASPESPCLRR